MFQKIFFKETPNTHFTLNKCFHKNREVYEIVRKNMGKLGRPQITTWWKRFAC